MRLLCAGLFLALLCSAAAQTLPPQRTTVAEESKIVSTPGRVLLISDTQEPLWMETLLLPEHQNRAARDLLFRSILADSGMRAVVHLGDMTESASDHHAWAAFDAFASALTLRGIRLFTTLGNHEYMLREAQAMEQVRLRFPDLKKGWHMERVGGLAFVLLNSNRSRLSTVDWAAQKAWYRGTLEQLEHDSTVSAIVVGCHHPPYTNSTIVDPSYDVQSDFVPPFLHSRKAILFVSGHAHAAEHFVQGGKDFLVLGGGGGLLQPLRTGTAARYKDLFPFRTERRSFHYVELVPEAGALLVRFHMIKRGLKELGVPYWFRVGMRSSVKAVKP
jgi:Icc-related predicted phosphoesterase